MTSAKRSPAVPDVPTLIESGIQVEANLWTGLFAPAGTPRAIVDKLNQEIGRMLDAPQMKQWLLESLGGEISLHAPEQFAAFLANDSARWQAIIKQIGQKRSVTAQNVLELAEGSRVSPLAMATRLRNIGYDVPPPESSSVDLRPAQAA